MPLHDAATPKHQSSGKKRGPKDASKTESKNTVEVWYNQSMQALLFWKVQKLQSRKVPQV